MAGNMVLTREVEVPLDWEKLGTISVKGIPGSGKTHFAKKVVKHLMETNEMDFRIAAGHPEEWNGKDISVDESKLLKQLDDEDYETASEEKTLEYFVSLIKSRLVRLKRVVSDLDHFLLVIEEDYLRKATDNEELWRNLLFIVRTGRAAGVYVLFVNSFNTVESETLNEHISNFVYTSEYKTDRVPELEKDEIYIDFDSVGEPGAFKLEE